ncbi:MAG TPA: barstar family protein [Sedimentibacter sp.]|nr:barstar family protein [Sedimentibacter sp.]HQB63130.1 barstar family protein [Sedimentibacter sp.]
MEEIFLDASQMTSKSEAHRYIKKMLNFPDYYGKNLDALWDLLTTKSKMTSIFLLNEEKLYENLGEYGKKLSEVFKDAAGSNPNIEFTVM